MPVSEPAVLTENNATKISGDWLATTVQSVEENANGHALAAVDQIDWSQLGRVDSAGAFALLHALGVRDLGDNVPEQLRRVLDIVAPAMQEHATKKPRKSYGFFTGLGRKVVTALGELYGNIVFLGRSEVGVGRAVINPRRLRVRALVSVMQQGSLEALPIIMTMTFFIGAVVALVGTNLLQNLGASVFTVQLVGVSVLREFGVLIPAILLAGRSTSTFAAQIGAMRMNQETSHRGACNPTRAGDDHYSPAIISRSDDCRHSWWPACELGFFGYFTSVFRRASSADGGPPAFLAWSDQDTCNGHHHCTHWLPPRNGRTGRRRGIG